MKKLRRRVEKFKGMAIGLDLHKSFIQVSVLNREGDETFAQRIGADRDSLIELIHNLQTAETSLAVAIEASGCFLWVFDLLVDLIGHAAVKVAAPSKVKVIAEAGEKDDASDAWWLAYLLHEGRLPEAFVAEGDLRELRIATREHRVATDQRSDLMRRMRSHLQQLGITFAYSDWRSQIGRDRIDALVREVTQSQGMRGEAINRLWQRIQQLDQEVEHWNGHVATLSAKFDEAALIEDQLPGVGQQIAASVWAELGDPRRYRSARAYAKATGLTPGYRRSGGRLQKKGISREGSTHVRWALTRAIIGCLRCTRHADGVAVKRWVQNMMRRKSKKAAIVAAARKLAEGIWRLFALGEAFDLRRMFPCG